MTQRLAFFPLVLSLFAATSALAAADLSVSIGPPSSNTIRPGNTISLSLQVTNSGPGPTAGTEVLEIPLPMSVSSTGVSSSGWVASFPGWRFTLPVLAQGASTFKTIAFVAPSAASVVVNAEVNAPSDPSTSNNTDSRYIPIVGNWSDIEVTLTGPQQVQSGAVTTYDVNLKNWGPYSSSSQQFTISLDGATFGTDFKQTSGPAGNCGKSFAFISCTLPTLNVGTSVHYQFGVTSPLSAGSTFTIHAEMTYDPGDANHFNDAATLSPSIRVNPPELTASFVAPSFIPAGVPLTIAVTMRDSGDPALNPRMTFTPTAGSSVSAVTQSDGPSFQCGLSGGIAVCQGASLDASHSATFLVTVHVGALTGTFQSTLSVTSDTTPPVTIPINVPIVQVRRHASR